MCDSNYSLCIFYNNNANSHADITQSGQDWEYGQGWTEDFNKLYNEAEAASVPQTYPSQGENVVIEQTPSDLQDAMNLTGTGREQASGGASSEGKPVHVIEKPLSVFPGRVSTYTKSHKFMTFGLASVVLSNQATGRAGEKYLTTYLAEVPWHLPIFYLNQSEYDIMNPGAKCIEVSLEVYYRGSVIQFATAETSTHLATLNQINDIAVAYGLNMSGQGQNINFTGFNPTQTMIPTSMTAPIYQAITGRYRGMDADYYGRNNDNLRFDFDMPKHNIGRQTFLYNYWALNSQDANNAVAVLANTYGGWPCLTDKIKQYDGKTVVNQKIMSVKYTPQLAPLKAPHKTIGHGLPIPGQAAQPTLIVPGLHTMVGSRLANISPVGTSQPVDGQTNANIEGISSNMVVGGAGIPNFNIFMPIEKSQYAREGYWGMPKPQAQPSVHIGVQPVPSLTSTDLLTSDDVFNSWTDTRGYWEVVATMKVLEQEPTAYPYAVAPNVPFGKNVMFNPLNERPAALVNPRSDGATFCKLYTLQDSALSFVDV